METYDNLKRNSGTTSQNRLKSPTGLTEDLNTKTRQKVLNEYVETQTTDEQT